MDKNFWSLYTRSCWLAAIVNDIIIDNGLLILSCKKIKNICEKASISINGVSLTISKITRNDSVISFLTH